MSTNKNSSGFTIVEGFLIILILAIVGFAGYYMYHARKASDKTRGNAAASSGSRATRAKDSNQKWLVIKEWGVEIPQPSDDTLSYDELDTSDNPGSLSLISRNLATYGCITEGAGTILRGTATGSWEQGQLDGATKIGNYYYVWMADQGSCTDPAPANMPQSAQSNANQEAEALFSHLRAIPQ